MTPKPIESKYPPYACKCCGYTNGDMFMDYYKYEPTEMQVTEFDTYKKMWNLLNDERKEARAVLANRRVFTARKPRKKYTKKSPYWADRSKE